MKVEHSELRSNETVRWFTQSVLLRVHGKNRASVLGDRAQRTASRHEDLMSLHKNSQSGC